MPWRRPDNVAYPQEWLRFESPKSGQKFVVKDLTPEYYDISLCCMTNMFLKESAIAGPLNILEDPVARVQMQQKWLAIMRANMAIIVVTEDELLPRVAAIHLTLIREKTITNGLAEPPSEGKFSQFSKVVIDLKNEGNLFDKFQSDHYLGSLGLFVLPEYRGQGIATEILKARLVMCKALGLRGTATVFSTAGARAAATSAGYSVLATRRAPQLAHEIAVMAAFIE